MTKNSVEIFAKESWCDLRPISVSDAAMPFEWWNLDRASSLGGAPRDV